MDMMETLVKAMNRQTELLEAIAQKENGEGLKTKTPANFSTATPLHGDGGIWAVNGLERDVITAHVRPYGIASQIPLLPSVDEDPRFGILTGYTADSGSQPTYACQDAPTGYVKGCTLTSRFGMVRYDTQTIEMDKVMLKLHRGDFTDLVLRGRVLGLTNLPPSGMNEGQILNVITMSEMVGAAVRAERNLSTQIWQGDWGTSNQFPGLDSQIATGIKDAETGTLCPAADSDVKDFALSPVGGTARSIVEYLSSMEWYLRNNAMTMGLDPVDWVIAMRPELWFEVSSVWPCQYHTNKCASSVIQTSTVFVDGRENTAERDAMRNGMYIDINGNRYPVVVDTGIFEHNSTNNASLIPGEYASSIYMLPRTIVGNFPVLYRQYVDYRQAATDVNLLRGLEDFFWTDNGVYSWAVEQVKWCYKLALKTEQRIILRTPHLAGRVDRVKYAPLQHLRDPYPDSPYFKDGGVSLRGGLGSPVANWS